MNSATTEPDPNIYELIGKLVVIVAAVWLCIQIVGVATAAYSQIRPVCATIERHGRVAHGWMSHTLTGAYRIQQHDGTWAFFAGFDSLTLPYPNQDCDFPADWKFQL